MLRIISFILVVSGGVLMIFSAIKYNKLFKDFRRNSENVPSYSVLTINVLRFIILFFITGFAVGAIDIASGEASPMLCFTGIVFFTASVFAFLLINNLYMLSKTLNRKNAQLKEAFGQIETQNARLQSEIENRVKKIMQQDKLLRTVNDISSILLSSDVEKFNEAIFKCMSMLAKSVDVDRTYIWENHTKNGALYCTQLFEWSGGAEPQQGNDLTVDVAFPEDWRERLSNNKCVNGIVSSFPKREKEHLEAQGIVSILVVPVFLKNKFWGFVGFDDCRNERTFSEAEEGVLRSASLLIATSLLRNEMTQKLMQAREEALSSTKAKTNFLSNMSHEIRTPINAITGMTAIARMADTREKITDCLDKIDTASYQLLGLLNDILDMSKIEAGKMELSGELFNLRKTFENVKNIMSFHVNEKKQTFSMEMAEDIPEMVIGDDVRLSQIFINLISNAVKFTDKNGKIDFRVKMTAKNESSYMFEASVCDNGIGISQEQQQRLFRAFEQAERNTSRMFGGTGLGLTISKSIAKMMDGNIFVKSKLGEGSCFIVNFQLKRPTDEMLEAKNDKNDKAKTVKEYEGGFSGYGALVVEDIEINREIMSAILKPTGLSVEFAENGEEAVKALQNNPDKYDIIFMDIQMPVMDGYEAAKKIRSLEYDNKTLTVPIIAITANAYKEDVEKSIESGMNGHIAKPIDVNAVMKILNKFLKKDK